MLAEFNGAEFGERLKDLREKRFRDSPRRFSYCKSQTAFMTTFAAEKDDGKGCRQTLKSWEEGKTIPTIPDLYQICRLLDCTPEYLLGRDSEVNKDTTYVAKTIGLTIKSVNEIKGNEDVSQLLEWLLQQNNFLELCAYIKGETIHRYLEVELMQHFGKELQKHLERAFDCAFAKATPFDDLSELYKRELRKRLLPTFLPDPQSKLKDYVSKDVLCIIERGAEESDISPQTDAYYNLIIETLANFSIQPLSYRKEAEQTAGKIAQMFTVIITPYIKDKHHAIRQNIKQRVQNEGHPKKK